MKIDFSHSNVLGTPLRVLDADAETNLSQLKREIGEFFQWHRLTLETAPEIQAVVNAARAILTSQIRGGLWAAWDIYEPTQMGHLVSPDIPLLKAFTPASRDVDEAREDPTP
jgi:hypothetical protein